MNSSKAHPRFLLLLAALAAATFIASTAPTARAVPGEITADGPHFKVKNRNREIDKLSSMVRGRVVARLDDGSYLAFGDTAKNKRLARRTFQLLERRVLRIRHFSRRGKLDRRFDKSQIGRGVTLGGAGQVWNFMGIVRPSPGVFIAWAGHTDLGTGTPSMKAVAFNPRTGRLIRSFGVNGVQRFGRVRGLTEGAFMVTKAMHPLADGRVISCGAMRVPKLFTVDSRSRLLLNVTGLTDNAPRPFLASGSRGFGLGETAEDGAFRECRAIAQSPSGRILIAGQQGVDYNLNGPVKPWLVAFNPNGTLDSSFGADGTVVFPESFGTVAGGQLIVRSLIADRFGGSYVGGWVYGGPNRGFVVRLDASGQIDTSFGSGGLAVIPKFTVNDVSEGDDGALLLTGTTSGETGAPAAGRLTSTGAWDPNFYGAGFRVYPFAYTDNFYQLLSGPIAYLWESTDGDVREVLRVENQVTLDSSIISARRAKNGDVVIGGVASDPAGVSAVDVAIARKGELPTTWIRASGTHLWSAVIPNPGRSKSLVVFSRTTSSSGAIEEGFSTADRNWLDLG